MYGDVVQTIARSRDLLIQIASVREFEEAQDARKRISQEFSELRSREEEHRRTLVVDRLSHVCCDDRHEQLRAEIGLYPESTRWVFNETKVSEWLHGLEANDLTLWVFGIPGAGMSHTSRAGATDNLSWFRYQANLSYSAP